MTDLNEKIAGAMIEHQTNQVPVLARVYESDFTDMTEARLDLAFTKSRGTIMSRLYERLTKASRRRTENYGLEVADFNFTPRDVENAYRQGVYNAYKALQDEMA